MYWNGATFLAFISVYPVKIKIVLLFFWSAFFTEWNCTVVFFHQPTDYKFEFPDLFPTEKKDADMKQMQETKRNYEKRMNQSGERKGVPAWFTYWDL